ncbi:MAG: hypothetical protein GEU83_03455 [Pseudonocardiaceae bacterium]|nr:hypothetical protein [Pseudonocardiaceae bacterium]
MAELKDRLRADLTTALKARDSTTVATLRMALAAISNEEVAGKSSRELRDEEVLTVLGRETKKRREAAEARRWPGEPREAGWQPRCAPRSLLMALRVATDRTATH